MGRKNNKYGYSSVTAEELRKYAKFLIVPVIVIIMVLMIALAEPDSGDSESAAPTDAQSVESSSPEEPALTEGTEASTEAETEPAAAEAFTKNGVPEVMSLIETYFAAKENADVETIYSLFGQTDMEGAEALKSEYSYTSRYTEGYQNLTCYTKPGPVEGSYLVYVSYELKFKDVETAAPGLFKVYAVPDAEGNLKLADTSELSPEIQKLFEEAEQTDELILLKTQIYAQLRQALETDADLAGVYGVLQKNSQFSGEETKGDSTVSLVTEAAASGDSAEGETEESGTGEELTESEGVGMTDGETASSPEEAAVLDSASAEGETAGPEETAAAESTTAAEGETAAAEEPESQI